MKVTKAEFTAGLVQQQFWNDFRELTGNFSEVHAGIVAYLQLNYPQELISISKEPAPTLYRKLLTEALITLIDRGALVQVSGELTDLAVAELAKLRRETGIGVETLPAPPPKPPTADELLEAQVRQDFDKLPSAQMRAKRQSNRAYEKMYQKIVDSLGTTVSSHHDLGNLGS